jgi:hypothetical protein
MRSILFRFPTLPCREDCGLGCSTALIACCKRFFRGRLDRRSPATRQRRIAGPDRRSRACGAERNGSLDCVSTGRGHAVGPTRIPRRHEPAMAAGRMAIRHHDAPMGYPHPGLDLRALCRCPVMFPGPSGGLCGRPQATIANWLPIVGRSTPRRVSATATARPTCSLAFHVRRNTAQRSPWTAAAPISRAEAQRRCRRNARACISRRSRCLIATPRPGPGAGLKLVLRGVESQSPSERSTGTGVTCSRCCYLRQSGAGGRWQNPGNT